MNPTELVKAILAAASFSSDIPSKSSAPLFPRTNFKGRSTISKTLRRKRTNARKAAKRMTMLNRNR